MNLGMHVRFSENLFRENLIIFKKMFFRKKMFQDPKGYKEQMCEIHLQYGNSTKKWRFNTFFYLIPLYSYLFSLNKSLGV